MSSAAMHRGPVIPALRDGERSMVLQHRSSAVNGRRHCSGRPGLAFPASLGPHEQVEPVFPRDPLPNPLEMPTGHEPQSMNFDHQIYVLLFQQRRRTTDTRLEAGRALTHRETGPLTLL